MNTMILTIGTLSMVSKMSLGCDPEFFLRHRTTKHNVSAHDKVPGTKKNPHRLPNGGSVQADGTAIEFNTEPAYTKKQFSDNILSCLNDIRKMVDSKYEFMFKPVVHYGAATYDRIPDNAKELGCNPDYDAYTLNANDPPKPPAEHPTMRTGAGHIHIGWGVNHDDPHNRNHMEDCAYFVKQLDSTLYQDACNWWAYSMDELLRRRVYGKKGAFRPKPFGAEYRSLSNSWLAHGAGMYEYIFTRTEYVFNRAMDAKYKIEYHHPPHTKPNAYM